MIYMNPLIEEMKSVKCIHCGEVHYFESIPFDWTCECCEKKQRERDQSVENLLGRQYLLEDNPMLDNVPQEKNRYDLITDGMLLSDICNIIHDRCGRQWGKGCPYLTAVRDGCIECNKWDAKTSEEYEIRQYYRKKGWFASEDHWADALKYTGGKIHD